MRDARVPWLLSILCGLALAACGNPSTVKPRGDGGGGTAGGAGGNGGNGGGGADAGQDAPDGGSTPDAPGTTCTAGEKRCFGSTLRVCESGAFKDLMTCPSPKVCTAGALGCVDCDPSAGDTCQGTSVRKCNADGTIGPVVMDCAPVTCEAGRCLSSECAAAARSRSYLGCEYWPVDLDNGIELQGEPMGGTCPGSGGLNPTAQTLKVCEIDVLGMKFTAGLCEGGTDCSWLGDGSACGVMWTPSCVTKSVCALDGQHAPYAVAVANPDKVSPAQVTLSNATGITHKVTVPPGMILPIFPQMSGFPDQSLDATSIEPKAYKLTSDRPIAAYQFNPLDNVGVFTNDASLLLPATTFDRKYLALTYPTLMTGSSCGISQAFRAYITVVASAPGDTTVEVSPRAKVVGGSGIPAFGPGGMKSFTLKQFDTLNLEAAEGDLSGSLVTGDRPFGMYVGHEATNLSNKSPVPCCADHLEDSLFPASTWGKSYVVAHSASSSKRSAAEPDLVRVMAQEADTTVTFNPPQSGCATLGPGQFCEVFIPADAEVTADKPILVAHYLLSAGPMDNNGPSGDPSMSFAVPSEQYRNEYTLLVPSTYDENHASIVVPAGGTVLLDGTDVTAMTASFGSGRFRAGRIRLTPGQHTVSCGMTCGVEVYGWSGAVSYMYAGGLDLTCINPGGTAGGSCD